MFRKPRAAHNFGEYDSVPCYFRQFQFSAKESEQMNCISLHEITLKKGPCSTDVEIQETIVLAICSRWVPLKNKTLKIG